MRDDKKARECRACGRRFSDGGAGANQYCSIGCKKRMRVDLLRERSKDTEDAICIGCAGTFARPKYQATRRYCTPECRDKSILMAVTRPRFFLFERDEFRCVYCGLSSVEEGLILTIDHIVPRSGGGTDDAGNLVTCCRECNSSKGRATLAPAVMERLLRLVATRNEARGILSSQPVVSK